MSVAAVLLAAGGGSRYAASGGSGHKLLAAFRGRTVVDWAADHALQAGLGPLYVVTGSVDLPLTERGGSNGMHLIHNARWHDGMATSLQAALVAARRAGHEAVVVGLGDQPLIDPEAWRRVGTASAPIAVATYSGERGHPVRLAEEVWAWLPATGDGGARRVMDEHPELVTEVPCPGCPADVDTVEDLSRWS
jgi:CTP:molybdopterin cytidylyltransferase MocA